MSATVAAIIVYSLRYRLTKVTALYRILLAINFDNGFSDDRVKVGHLRNYREKAAESLPPSKYGPWPFHSARSVTTLNIRSTDHTDQAAL